MIKVLICDGDGTLQLPSVSDEMVRFVEWLRSKDIKLVVASNSTKSEVMSRFSSSALTAPNLIVTPSDVGARKPSPDFVESITDHYNVERNEVAYLGDNTKTDMLCAVNGKVLPLAAEYSDDARNIKYGLPIYNVEGLIRYFNLMATQGEPYFGWKIRKNIFLGLDVNVSALIGQHSKFTNDLKIVLKEGKDVKHNHKNYSLRTLLSYYLITQCFLSGLVHQADIITVYPGHRKDETNPTMEYFCNILRLIFRKKFIPNLIIRHRKAPQSKKQSNRDIRDQLRTIHINPDYKEALKESTVMVFDDFTTSGRSFEAARLMLKQAKVSKVLSVAMAKYRLRHYIVETLDSWDPFRPFNIESLNIFDSEKYYGSSSPEPDDYFYKNIYKRFIV